MLGSEVFNREYQADPVLGSEAKQEFGVVFSAFGSTSIATYHPINAGVMGVGKPISIAGVKELLGQFEVDGVAHASPWNDPDILYSDSRYLVFKTNKGCKQTLWFRLSQAKQPVEVRAVLPTIIYVFERTGRLSLFASASDAVTPNSQLYVAPFFNTSSTGYFCAGSAVLPSGALTDQQIKDGVLEAVYRSNFTHSTGNNFGFKSAKSEKAHIAIWQKCAERKRAPTSRQLVKFDKTLSEVLKG